MCICIILCFRIGHKKSSVGCGDNMANIFILETFYCINVNLLCDCTCVILSHFLINY